MMGRELTEAEWEEVLSVPAVRDRFNLDHLTPDLYGQFLSLSAGVFLQKEADLQAEGLASRCAIVCPTGGAGLGAFKLMRKDGALTPTFELAL